MEHYCNLCKQLGILIQKKASRPEDDEMENHAETHHLQLKLANGLSISAVEMFKKCFPTETSLSLIKNSDDKKHKRNNPVKDAKLAARCRDLFDALKKTKKLTAHCFECRKDIKIFNQRSGRLHIAKAISHVTVHLGKPLFECRHCDYRCSCKASLGCHLKVKHGVLMSNKANYVDLSGNYQKEIIAMIKRCFDQRRAASLPEGSCTTSGKHVQNRIFKQTFQTYDRALSDFCLTLFPGRAKTEVRCAECGTKRTIFKRTTTCTNSAINHAITHLKKPLFACRGHCDREFQNRSAMRVHLRRSNLDCKKSNYIDSSSQYQQEIICWLKRCYGQQQEPQADQIYVTGNTSLMRVANFCRKLFANQNQIMDTICYECGSKLRLFESTGHVKPTKAIEHACVHLNKLLFGCRQCDNRYASKSALNHHLKIVHKLNATAGNYNDYFSSYEQEIMDQLKCCFEQRPGVVANKIKSKKISSSRRNSVNPLVTFCYDLFLNRRADSRVKCLVCHRKINFFEEGGLKLETRTLINHAYIHLKKKLFHCRRCDYRTTTKANIKAHLKQIHKSAASIDNYEDLSHHYLNDVKAMIKRCFVEQSATETPEQDKIIGKDYEKRYRPPLRKFCHALFLNRERVSLVECLICHSGINLFRLTYLDTNAVINHAYIHLQKELFKCLMCGYRATKKVQVAKHLKDVHQLGTSNNEHYEDLSFEYLDEIKDVITRCFKQPK